MTVIDCKHTKWNDKEHSPALRCEATIVNGQCRNIKEGGTNFCFLHGANKGIAKANSEIQRNYRLGRWQERINQLADNDQIKSLREEVGILRMMMEEILTKCEDSTDLLLYSSRISDLAMKIERLVISCDRLENRMGQLLSKRAVLQLAGEYVQIINTFVTDPETMEQIGTQMLAVTQRVEHLSSEE